MTKKWLAVALSLAVVATLTPDLSEAKRLGGGKPMGMQRQAPDRAPAQTPPSQSATPAPASPTAGNPAVAGAAAAAPAAAAAKRSWMGPIAGLAAGLGIAALLSHFGLGEGMANILMMALLAMAAFFVIRLVMRRFAGAQPRTAAAGAGAQGGQTSWTAPSAPAESRIEPTPLPVQRAAVPAGAADMSVTGAPLAPIAAVTAPVAAVAAAASGPVLPEGFDLPAFERVAKMIFIRLQAANDAGDLDDLREFTTPEMFSNIRLELQERGGVAQHTDVEKVDAEMIEFVQEATRQVASVRFHGLVREEQDAPAVAFDEVWHLVKPVDGSRAWAIAGIQQPH